MRHWNAFCYNYGTSPVMRTRAVATILSIAATLIPSALPADISPDIASSWKHYRNKQWGYCINYPAHWFKGDAFEGSGIFIKARAKKHVRFLGEMDVSAIPDGPDNLNHPVPVRLTESLQTHLDGLRKFERAQQLEILEQRPIELHGTAALFTKDRYFDPQDGKRWIDEIVLVNRDQTLYTLELVCRSEQVAHFEPVFTQFVSTFQLDCRSH